MSLEHETRLPDAGVAAPSSSLRSSRPARRRTVQLVVTLLVVAVLVAAAVVRALVSSDPGEPESPTRPVLISDGVPVSASSAVEAATAANDGDHDTAWRSTGVPAELVYDLSGVPAAQRQRVLAHWSNASYGYDTTRGPHYNNLGAYSIDVNPAAGGDAAPQDGWVTQVEVDENTLHSRQHLLDLDGASWVRLRTTRSDGAPANEDASVTAFDLYSLGAGREPVPDDFVFYGDSITAAGLCLCTQAGVPALPELLRDGGAEGSAIVENGGVPFATSEIGVSSILGESGYLSLFPGTYVGLSYGMNDAAAGITPEAFSANMTALVEGVLAAGKVPMVPTISSTGDEDLNAVLGPYNDVIDRLYDEVPELVEGPDLWAFFSERPELLTPGDIHPTDEGYAALRQEWASVLLTGAHEGGASRSGTTAGGAAGSGAEQGAAGSGAAGAGAEQDGVAAGGAGGASSMVGLRVSGNRVLNGAGVPVRLLGVNHSGSEYACVGGGGAGSRGYAVFEPADFDTDPAYLDAIKTWGSNTVRIGLNEACWLGINGVDPAYSGANYQSSIRRFVDLATSKGLAVVLELHWSAPGTGPQFVPHGQSPMPNRQHTPTLWKSVAQTFKAHSNVAFDLFNEPYPGWNQDSTNAWQCWRDGSAPTDPTNSQHCIGSEWWDTDGNTFNGGKPYTYPVAGMQELLTAVRSTGATNLVLLSGIQYANRLSQWLTHQPTDPAGNLAAAWHVYPFNQCNTPSCWDSQIAPVASRVPLVATEIGDHECKTTYTEPLMSWLDQHHAGYQAWTWNAWGCGGLQLMTDYRTGTPTPYGQVIHDHLRRVTQRDPTG